MAPSSPRSAKSIMFLILFAVSLIFVQEAQAEFPLDPIEAQALEDIAQQFPFLTQLAPGIGPWGSNGSLACDDDWYGISCTGSDPNHVATMNMLFFPVGTGYIPDSIQVFQNLSLLTIKAQFTRPIPSSIQLLRNLTTLQLIGPPLDETTVVQPFPNWIFTLPRLDRLWLAGFKFVGAGSTVITSNTINSLTLDKTLFLHQFPTFGPLPKVVLLTISGAGFSGPIPSWILNLDPTLTLLDLSQNNFSGMIPNFSRFENLSSIYLSSNNLEGDISSALVGPIRNQILECNVSYNPQLVCPASFSECCAEFKAKQPRVVGCIGFECPCSSDLSSISVNSFCINGTWAVSGAATNNQSLVIGQTDQIIINGSFVQNPDAILQIYTNATHSGEVIVGGDLQLGGNLTIIVTSSSASGTITIINGAALNGSFSNTLIQQQFEDTECYETTGEAQYTSTAVLVVLSQSKKMSCNKGLIIGVAVGGSVLLILILAAIVAIILYVKLRAPQRVRPTSHSAQSVL